MVVYDHNPCEAPIIVVVQRQWIVLQAGYNSISEHASMDVSTHTQLGGICLARETKIDEYREKRRNWKYFKKLHEKHISSRFSSLNDLEDGARQSTGV